MMAEYRCISCGAVRESEASCSCPECGYKMYETPYERSEVLKKEIVGFLSRLKISEIDPGKFEMTISAEKLRKKGILRQSVKSVSTLVWLLLP